jgi:hypothetical protein
MAAKREGERRRGRLLYAEDMRWFLKKYGVRVCTAFIGQRAFVNSELNRVQGNFVIS